MKVRRLPTLLVKSKTRGKAVLHTTFEGHRDRVPSSGDIHSYGAWEMDRRDLTNRVCHGPLWLPCFPIPDNRRKLPLGWCW
jgi:hypothetical protein